MASDSNRQREGVSAMSDLLVAVLRSGTPLIYVTLAAVLAQRAGIWHLGLEGLMIAGACIVVVGTATSGSLAIGMALAIFVCVIASVLLWYVVEKLRADPIIAGLGLSGLGLGGTHLAMQAVFDTEGTIQSPIGLPKLAMLPAPYSLLSILVAAMPLVVLASWIVLRRTRFGLLLAACGEHPFAARSIGADPAQIRLIALAAGGVLCALGGAELALGSLQFFTIEMTAGRGYMAFAAAIFGGAHPIGATAAAVFFAVVEAFGIQAQLAFSNVISPSLLLTLPYLATVIALWLSGYFRGAARVSSASIELKDS